MLHAHTRTQILLLSLATTGLACVDEGDGRDASATSDAPASTTPDDSTNSSSTDATDIEPGSETSEIGDETESTLADDSASSSTTSAGESGQELVRCDVESMLGVKIVTTQTQLDMLEGCEYVVNDLTLCELSVCKDAVRSGGDPITDLSPLAQVQIVERQVTLASIRPLLSLDALPKLVRLESLMLHQNPNLNTVELPGVAELPYVFIQECANLERVILPGGMYSLILNNNPKLASISGPDEVEEVGDFWVAGSPRIRSIPELSKVRSAVSLVFSDISLTAIRLPELRAAESLVLRNVPSMQRRTRSGASLTVDFTQLVELQEMKLSATHLADFSGFSALARVETSLEIVSNPNFDDETARAFVERLDAVGDVKIAKNGSLRPGTPEGRSLHESSTSF